MLKKITTFKGFRFRVHKIDELDKELNENRAQAKSFDETIAEIQKEIIKNKKNIIKQNTIILISLFIIAVILAVSLYCFYEIDRIVTYIEYNNDYRIVIYFLLIYIFGFITFLLAALNVINLLDNKNKKAKLKSNLKNQIEKKEKLDREYTEKLQYKNDNLASLEAERDKEFQEDSKEYDDLKKYYNLVQKQYTTDEAINYLTNALVDEKYTTWGDTLAAYEKYLQEMENKKKLLSMFEDAKAKAEVAGLKADYALNIAENASYDAEEALSKAKSAYWNSI